MKTLIIPLIFSLAASTLVFAASVSAAEDASVSPQRQKFADCAHKSKGLKGEEHKKFMGTCLSGEAHAMTAEEAAEHDRRGGGRSGGSRGGGNRGRGNDRGGRQGGRSRRR